MSEPNYRPPRRDGDNPFAPPKMDGGFGRERGEDDHYGDASQGQRAANMFIDTIAFYFVAMFAFAALVLAAGQEALDELPAQLIAMGVMFLYYGLLEGVTGRTIGKLITGTKVVAEDGGSPSFGQILGRTTARLVPFEAFSFLGGNLRGWHDTWSKTRVVRTRPAKWEPNG